MDNFSIKGVGDFLRVVKCLYPKESIAYFRGQPSSQFNVNSSFSRLVKDTKRNNDEDNFSYLLSNKLFREFKNNMPAYSENNLLKEYALNDIDLMLVAQHYGLATRLIDWTKSPLVALYFATEKESIDGNCSVYMIYDVPDFHPVFATSSHSFSAAVKGEQAALRDIYELLEHNIMNDVSMDIANRIHSIINRYGGNFLEFPIKISQNMLAHNIFQMALALIPKKLKCSHLISLVQRDNVNALSNLNAIKIYNNTKYIIEPLPINLRIKHQQGVFIFSNELEGDTINNELLGANNKIKSYHEEEIARVDESKGVVRIDISGKYMREIHEELNLYGISKDFIYPELPSYTEVMQKRVVKELLAGKI